MYHHQLNTFLIIRYIVIRFCAIIDFHNNKLEPQSVKIDIVNVEQFEYWNDKSGPKWVKLDDSMNERFSILTDELFRRTNINKNDNWNRNRFGNYL